MWLAMAVPSCSSIADRSAPPVSRSSSCWPSAWRIEPAPRGVAGVGLEATEQGREHGGGGGAHLVGGGPDLLRDLVGRQRAEDVVDCGHGVPFRSAADRLRPVSQPSPGVAGSGTGAQDTGGTGGCMIGV